MSYDDTIPAYYYYVDPENYYQPQVPNPLNDLISQYDLDDISQQVARTNTDGSKAVKLRKSYKNQIAELSGKFSNIPTRENGKGGEIAQVLFQNNPDMMANVTTTQDMTEEEYRTAMANRDMALFGKNNMDWDMASTVLSQFDRSFPSEFQNVQGFNIDDLAFDLDGTGRSNSKKRKVNISSGSSMTTPNGNDIEDIKRRRLD
ncbi:hypothetical protein TPHA_0K00630 [Tetrapisispora phaffii CBS 4417]|uniref:Mediator of RNA polymerase II transcription subunit 19 n=1 Tax=Tetrapisispora phaffii (strain ATCC 24235 / CBS 4417 / NBRC 1672 / NRRL Y-8282 / UCD 70-5) TaxID=1071381 RepID=G8BZ69_TETPH|nr:hypothetical protein TPHA_0K00630 [Tetrapisispora phaffii CBS 4417]CCE65197.1 hypothetical protein TPHA_0K00630 [Tetrapisispora phaffii CBS 4417]